MKRGLILVFALFLGCFGELYAQGKSITGVVSSSEDGLPIPGVSVIVKGTTIGTTTSADGRYVLNVRSEHKVLVFSFMGMKTRELPISGSVLNVVMDPEAIGVDEVVVVAYGTAKKSALTGAVGVVDADAFETKPVANFNNLLQGSTPGVMAISSSGRPGSGSAILIRGVTSARTGATAPLYVMDGVFINSGDVSALNPNDIESVSILKDASAASLYGSRASNGVVLITTKKGRKGNTEIAYRVQFGYNAVASSKSLDMMNTTQLLDFEEYIGVRTPGTYERDSLEQINTNWKDEILRNTKVQQHDFSVRGGSDKTSFYLSAGYYTQEGIIPRSDFKRYSARINIDHKARDWFRFGNTLTVSYEKDNHAPSADISAFEFNFYNPIWAIHWLKPYAQPKNPDGSWSSNNMAWSSPQENWEVNERYTSDVKAVGSIYAEIEPVKNVKFRTTLGVDFNDFNFYRYLTPEHHWGADQNGEVSRTFERYSTLTNSNILSYDRECKSHYMNLLLGQESVSYQFENLFVHGYQFANDKFKVLDAAAEVDNWEGGISEYTVLSYFSRLKYVFKNKYHLDVSFRRDGSSRFGKENRWANFWSLGAMWNVLEESFVSKELISDLRLKLSYGTTGNYNIGNYRHLSTYDFKLTYNDLNASAPEGPGNSKLTWEKTATLNGGIDVEFWNKYRLGLELYRKKTTDMLFEIPFSFTSGFRNGYGNVGTMLNSGIEVNVNLDLIKTADFLWNINANFAYNKNEITELYGGLDELEGDLKVGESVGTFYEVRSAGVNPANGEPLYCDKNGNITNVYSEDDAVWLSGKSWIAPWSGGFSTALEYKRISFSAFFTWIKDKYMGNNMRYFTENPAGFSGYNYSTKMLEHWKQPGDITEVPHPSYSMQWTDRLIENASFLRLKNISISYHLPKKWTDKLYVVEAMKVYVQGQNLFTLTNYTGLEPEYHGKWAMTPYPQYKAYTFGLDVKF